MQIQMIFTYYNFVRVHSAIGMTPAEKARVIEYLGQDTERKRWLYLIEEGSKITVSYLTIFINRILVHSQARGSVPKNDG